jgi:hypothetical protein
MSAHLDGLLLLMVAGALLAHARGRHLLAFLLLVGCFLIKVYLGPLAALYALWIAARWPGWRARFAAVAALGGIGATLTALAYLPFAGAGAKLFASAMEVSGHYSSGSPPNLVRRLLAATLPWFGLSKWAAYGIGAWVARDLAIAGIVVAFVVVTARLRAGRDPWPAIASYFLAYLLMTPWVFYWHEVPLLGIVAVVPWSLTSLVAVTLSVTLVPLVPAAPRTVSLAGYPPSAAHHLASTFLAFVNRYGGAFVALWLGRWARRRPKARTGDAHPAMVAPVDRAG